jgi:hypothetical protein
MTRKLHFIVKVRLYCRCMIDSLLDNFLVEKMDIEIVEKYLNEYDT